MISRYVKAFLQGEHLTRTRFKSGVGLTIGPASFDDLPSDLSHDLWIISTANLDCSGDVASINRSKRMFGLAFHGDGHM